MHAFQPYLSGTRIDTDPLLPTTYGAQGNKDHNNDNLLVLPTGPITRSRAKKYGATIIHSRTSHLHDLAFNKCYEELEGTLKFLTLMEAHVEMEYEIPTMARPRPCKVARPKPCKPLPLARKHLI
ncbi:hypothetical protein JCGZ_08857 [Jatropha curcas]|uniref:Uncharacterized protein n=1 Tax=Jatropha curcas TaxID=180498 RepID=A0A067KPK7_JATCU|nr:hypothetical protein JCGZ_08857 [Jatropha curcas]